MAYFTTRHPKEEWMDIMEDVMKDIDMSEIHDCKKCHGKIISITTDNMGVQRCGYCNKIVPYSEFINRKIHEKSIKRNNNKNG